MPARVRRLVVLAGPGRGPDPGTRIPRWTCTAVTHKLALGEYSRGEGSGAHFEAVVQETRVGPDDERWVPGLQGQQREPRVARHECLAAGAQRDVVPTVTGGVRLTAGLWDARRGDGGAGGCLEGLRDVCPGDGGAELVWVFVSKGIAAAVGGRPTQ